MTKPETFYSPCASCKAKTRHQVLHEAVERGDAEYDYYQSHGVIECLGCETKSFRYLFRDIENAYPVDDNEWDVPEDVKYYPKFDLKHSELEDTFLLPELVREIYQESLAAVQEDALTLAGLGLRGTIEAVCNDRGITGRSLEARITKLASQGLISAKDSERLHAIRFLGNDAAHEIKKPSSDQISVALKIINHLIQSVYLLELESAGKLDTIVTQPEEFKKLLDKHLDTFNSGDEFPLAKFLGKHIRRLGGGAAQLEAQLIAEIQAATYSRLAIGKVDNFAGSKAPVQHFVVV